MNRENMETWINALESYKGERAHCTLLDHDGNLCAMGIGLAVAGLLRTVGLEVHGGLRRISAVRKEEELAFRAWIGLTDSPPEHQLRLLDVPLKPDYTVTLTVTQANDIAQQDAWTIAQRLRETYLKEES